MDRVSIKWCPLCVEWEVVVIYALQRLEEHFERREWLHVDREATRLMMLEPLKGTEKGRVYRMWGRAKAGLNEVHTAIKLLEQAVSYAQKEQDWDCLGFVRADLGPSTPPWAICTAA